MWYPPTVTESPASEPISLVEAKAHLRVFHDDDDAYIGALVTAARDHAEKYCGAYWAEVEVVANCDNWCDLSWLPVTPVSDVVSIDYIVSDGASATLDSAVYEFRADARSIVLKPGQVWPAIQAESRISVTLDVGPEAIPPAVRHAILLRVEDLYENRGSGKDSEWSLFDSLLSNYRYY